MLTLLQQFIVRHHRSFPDFALTGLRPSDRHHCFNHLQTCRQRRSQGRRSQWRRLQRCRLDATIRRSLRIGEGRVAFRWEA